MFDETVNTGSGEGKFVHLKDGDRVIGVCRGDVKTFFALWNGKTYVESNEPDAKFRFKMNFIAKDGLAPKIIEQGSMLYNALKDLGEDLVAMNADADISKVWVQISRKGAGKSDTRYAATKVDNLTADELGAVDAVALHELGGSVADAAVGGSEADIPF